MNNNSVKIIKLQSCEGELFTIEDDVISMCSTVKNMLKGKSAFKNSLGGQFSMDGAYVILKKEGRILASFTKNGEEEAIITLPDVRTVTLQKVIEYCKYHNSEAPEREKKLWDQDFVQVKQATLCELASASYYLDIKPLVNLTSKAIASYLSGKSSEEIRETFFNINYEIYAPLFASSLATRCRLQKKYNSRKRVQDKDERAADSLTDNRSVEELVSFIETKSDKSTSQTKTSKKKTKKKEKKKSKGNQTQKSPPLASPTPQPIMSQGLIRESDEENEEPQIEEAEQTPDFSEEIDPEVDPALDQEVEEFRRRLEDINSQSKSIPKLRLQFAPNTFSSSMVGVH